ncbi:TraB/GumN family protein [Paenibacillus thailandensis]|uniref:TraB/GumN family protein n=1 Tax=Paenibacillus thailandensis TaxID=393250 RepID=A0ABW5QXK4_9BACL
MNKWKASLVSLFLSLFVLLSALPAAAAPTPVSVQVDGKKIEFASNEPIIDNGVTLAPLDALLSSLNVALKESGAETVLVAADGREVTLHTTIRTINGIKYIPVRSVGEAAGFEVRWDAATRTVVLTENEGGRGFLWEVKHNGNTVYLAGSMHIADSSFYPLHPSFEEAFDEADYLGVEVDISNAADPENQQLIAELGMYQDGTTLKDHISEETYKKLGAILALNGLDTNALDAYKPWVAETTISTLQSMQAGYESQTGIDLYFLQKAKERNMPVIELESYESQLNMFNSLSPELQESNLNAVLDGYNDIDDNVDLMAELWKSGDDEGLLELTKAMAQNEEYYKALLVDRNLAMTDKIVGYLNGTEKAEYLVVVGAAHFLGEDGIVKLLEDKGYTVTRK